MPGVDVNKISLELASIVVKDGRVDLNLLENVAFGNGSYSQALMLEANKILMSALNGNKAWGDIGDQYISTINEQPVHSQKYETLFNGSYNLNLLRLFNSEWQQFINDNKDKIVGKYIPNLQNSYIEYTISSKISEKVPGIEKLHPNHPGDVEDLEDKINSLVMQGKLDEIDKQAIWEYLKDPSIIPLTLVLEIMSDAEYKGSGVLSEFQFYTGRRMPTNAEFKMLREGKTAISEMYNDFVKNISKEDVNNALDSKTKELNSIKKERTDLQNKSNDLNQKLKALDQKEKLLREALKDNNVRETLKDNNDSQKFDDILG